jgi:hypothetical protein
VRIARYESAQAMAASAVHEHRADGSLVLTVAGVYMRQTADGAVEINARPRHLRVSPATNTCSVRTHFCDMGVQVRARACTHAHTYVLQSDEKAYVKRGVKRVHVSRSGLVVSDGNRITSMDSTGRIVSSM